MKIKITIDIDPEELFGFLPATVPKSDDEIIAQVRSSQSNVNTQPTEKPKQSTPQDGQHALAELLSSSLNELKGSEAFVSLLQRFINASK